MEPTTSGIGEVIRGFICAELDYEPHEVAGDTLLFTSGMVDSFTFVSLIALIESRLDLRLDPRDITVENFDSIGRIVAFLAEAAPRQPAPEAE